ncbi:type II toxin-antitoxin system RelE/ParE family toxin [Fusobacterium necrophorum]|uniref:Type II toxin-antitoxin system RelE/ParE family toxin n=1 Tax=Fusobacterium necrophorum TaxID=859 RepID=A0AAW6WD89_9FUSO|nr:type II toxin-antitoxin system RelE/ParE family toxin [Fusobacterium necrophorum]MDK4481523.1 type II toxin-antitoxin system RelE/ParE family toxin [Fusobacterium necrophorum]MDK4512582.1 type II toxin-antitoxin system RelE/ParE family toxin [Fusobacterium necrophorum]
MWKVEYYEKENGKIPVFDFIESTDKKMMTRIFQKMRLLEEYGDTLKEPYSKYLQKGIFELRVSSDTNISRIFYFFFWNKKIILTNGFIKKTQKTPKKEIEKALEYKKEFERRHKNGF